MNESFGARLDLNETGTRYQHYMELKEVFMMGIEVINQMSAAHRGEGDKAKKIMLENAVECIDKRLLFHSDYAKEMIFFASLPREINKASAEGWKRAQEEKKHAAQGPAVQKSTPEQDQSNPPDVGGGI